ncbi:hypothetical protein CXG50_04635 [Pseudomonas plecoglossicida]|nr:hypothetical protein CSW00_04420 [Pseudomonas sp. MR 02]PLP88382.1 hypothetical protein CX682_21065 [Pseudomonas sp. FFUP_PS_41]PLU99200.1 hypothetical protein CXG52_09240 [Pseudomonas plecoglossicida]PLV11073.1 hypothetical protein CXG50_04635 [Pseudomonas plecoglossicida]TXI06771.1 MAG: hypothetical protein E6Q70_07150 [Pseudomonas monteilii]
MGRVKRLEARLPASRGSPREKLQPEAFALSLQPYRWQASSHRYHTAFKTCVGLVGAGLPAIGPGQEYREFRQTTKPDQHTGAMNF